MSSLASLLPEPRNRTAAGAGAAGAGGGPEGAAAAMFGAPIQGRSEERRATAFRPPPYLQRKNFVPRTPEEFGDGGAFPEIHVAQFPLDMGRKDKRSQQVVSLQTDNKGKVRFDAIVRQGQRKEKTVFSRAEDLQEKALGDDELAKPTEEEEIKTLERTKKKLEEVVNGKLSSNDQRPGSGSLNRDPRYIRYTASQRDSAGQPACQKVIRMVESQVDPLEPSRFKNVKVPRPPGSPPVPVMHSPPRKLSAADMNDWKIPPCISNWKNPKGYTISLDKRLAADGRGTQEVTISDKFAQLSQALYIADRNARDDLERRNTIQRRVIEKEKQKKEEELRLLAQRAREERAGLTEFRGREEDTNRDPDSEQHLQDREQIREERRRKREREHRLEKKARGHVHREEDRDISEKIALGRGPVGNSSELMYDQRLFNQSQGLDSGLTSEDAYNLYDKPLFQGGSTGQMYRPSAVDSDTYGGGEQMMENLLKTDRFKPAKGFEGAEGGAQASQRDGPVQFEKEAVEEEDLFGLDHYMSKGSRKRPLDAVGSSGQMSAGAAGGGGGGSSEGYHPSKRSKVEFTRGSGDHHHHSHRDSRDRGRGDRERR